MVGKSVNYLARYILPYINESIVAYIGKQTASKLYKRLINK